MIVGKRLIVLAVLAMISLLATGWIDYWSTHVVDDAVDALDHTRDLLLNMDRLRGALAQAEADARGYAITAEPAMRSDFERAAGAVRESLAPFMALTTTEPRQRALVRPLGALVARRLDLLRSLIVLKDRGAAQSEINGAVNEGRDVNRAVGRILEQVRSEELRQLEVLSSRADASRRFAVWGPWIMCLIAVVMFAAMVAQAAATLRAARGVRENLRRAVALEQDARERAQQADQMKDDFLATVSHELRTPLTAIMGWCEILAAEDSRQGLLEEGLAAIHDAARIQSHLIEDLLDVSRVIAGRLKLSISSVDAGEIVDKAIASVAPSAHAKGITLGKHVEAPAPPLLADPARLQQVLWNLLSNAVKFTPSGGSVDVVVHGNASRLEIAVCDTGYGITAELLPHIFERFRQGDASGERRGGLGLGLSIVKSLVELHGGAVTAKSDGPGKGATFTVQLPLAPAAHAAAPSAAQSMAATA